MKPHRQIVSTGKCVASLCTVLVVLGILLLPGKGMAQNYTLSSGGSSATLNLGDGTGGTGNLGMNDWDVGTGNQLNQQWFWYAIGSATPTSIDQLPGETLNTSYAGANDLTVSYVNSQVSINVEYHLHGDGVGSDSADMMEYIWIDNISGSAVNFTFYQYSNFNLLGNNNNNVNIYGSPGAYTAANQTTGGPGGTGIAEVIVAPTAVGAEAGLAAPTLSDVENGSLNGNMSAAGNVAWAFQWTATIAAGGELDISKDKGLKVMTVPEPSTLALIALAMGALGLTLRRKLA
jgi:large repetitive protein